MVRKAVIKVAIVLITIGFLTFNFQERPVQVARWPIEPVTKSSIDDNRQSKNLSLDDIFISVKTSKVYHHTRLPIILKTWFQLAKRQTWFFTDTDSRKYQNLTNGHMVNTNCSPTHQRKDLCCKTAMEYDYFLRSGKKWFCHFDDDNYVNVPRLVSVLQKYNHQKDWYLGRTSIEKPIIFEKFFSPRISFWFATGGAGYCISSSLALKMESFASGGRFITICENIHLPDDVSLGFLIEVMLKTNLTQIPEFHSHFEQLKLLAPETFRDQITFSYNKYGNVVNVPGFNSSYDPTRFLSLHCFLFPHLKFCQVLSSK